MMALIVDVSVSCLESLPITAGSLTYSSTKQNNGKTFIAQIYVLFVAACLA
jgi:hypothetical protein